MVEVRFPKLYFRDIETYFTADWESTRWSSCVIYFNTAVTMALRKHFTAVSPVLSEFQQRGCAPKECYIFLKFGKTFK